MHYAVMVAYFAQSGLNINSFLSSNFPNMVDTLEQFPGLGQILFASSAGSILYFVLWKQGHY